MRVEVGIPAFCERQWLPGTLASLAEQDDTDFGVVVCVNQPRSWLNDPQHEAATTENLDSLNWLNAEKSHFPFRLRISDGVRPGLEPSGVGAARQMVFQTILEADPDALCISLDADTHVAANYISATRDAFQSHANAVALAAPYYHPLPNDPDRALHLLRYELYMRYYQLSLWRIGSPYAFLAIGSAFSFRGSAWKRTRGMPLRQAGEDFYFMQGMRKLGPVIRWLDSRVYPSARSSDRVPFGTGPLMSETDLGLQEQRFPFYRQSGFDLLGESFQRIPDLHRAHCPLPIGNFLEERLGGYRSFDGMRRNFSDYDRFHRAFHEKMDGLRTLQFLKWWQDRDEDDRNDADELDRLLQHLGEPVAGLTLDQNSIEPLNRLRDRLCRLEADFQKAFMDNWNHKAKW